MASIFEYSNDQKGQVDGLHEMHTIWKAIYQNLGLRQDLGDEALRFAGTFAKSDEDPRKILSEEKASQELQRVAGKEIKTLIGCASDLQKTVKVVKQLHDKSPSEKAERYTDSGLRGTIQVGKEITKSQKWTKADVARRRDEIEAFVKDVWAD